MAVVVALHFAIPGGRASPADFATAVAEELVMPFAPEHEDSSSPDGLASSDSVVALCFAIPQGRASPADFATANANTEFGYCQDTVHCDSGGQSFTSRLALVI